MQILKFGYVNCKFYLLVFFDLCYCLVSLLLLLLWPLSPLLLLLNVFVEMLHRVLVYLFVLYLLFSFLFGFLC